MKNIHILPTYKSSRLLVRNDKPFVLMLKEHSPFANNDTHTYQNIYITNSEEIKEGDWVIENHTFKREPYIGKCFYPKNDGTVTDEVLKRDLLSVNYEGHYETLALKHNCKKITLTTDKDLIADGVQAIDDEFLEWFVKNPSCERVEVLTDAYTMQEIFELKLQNGVFKYKIIIPQEKPKQETLEEAAEQFEYTDGVYGFKQGAKWMQERMYSEEDLKSAFFNGGDMKDIEEFNHWFEQFKKK
jgi:hypothetical protein